MGEVVWWGGSHPYRGMLVWSDHLNRWHSPRDRQSSILSQSCSSGRSPPLCYCCPRAPTPLHYTLRKSPVTHSLLVTGERSLKVCAFGIQEQRAHTDMLLK